MLAQQMHGYHDTCQCVLSMMAIHEIAVKSALLGRKVRCLVCGKELPPLS